MYDNGGAATQAESQSAIAQQTMENSALSDQSEDAIQKSTMTAAQAKAFENAVRLAAIMDGINANLLVGLAARESSLDPNAGKNSPPDAAKGLFQLTGGLRGELGLTLKTVFEIGTVVPVVAGSLSSKIASFGSVDLGLAAWTLGNHGTRQLFNSGGLNAVRSAYLDRNHKDYGTVGADYIDVIKGFLP
jgi:hypothetical protein